MKHATAIGHLRRLAEALSDDARLARQLGGQPPVVVAAYAFGDLLEGADRLEATEVAVVVDRPASELPWGAEPPEVRSLFERHRLDRVPLRWYCRAVDQPVANHRISRPVRIWSTDGPDEAALDALAARRAGHLRPPPPDPDELVRQLEEEAAATLAPLDQLVHGHRGAVDAIAEELFDLAWGYTDLRRGLAALRGQPLPAPDVAGTAHVWDAERYARLREAVRDRDGEAVVTLVGDAPLAEVAQLAGEGLVAALSQRRAGAAGPAVRCAQALRERDWEGDSELVEELESARGVGPAPARRAVPVDPGDVGEHLEQGFGQPSWRLELATGELWPDVDEFLDDVGSSTGEALPDDGDDPDAWLSLLPQGSREAYRDMASFAATVADRRLADRLDRALEGRGAFRRFRDLLADRPDEEGRWRVYSAERVRGRGRAWLAAHGYRPG